MLKPPALPFPVAAPFTPAFAARFWSKVAIGAPGECWHWQASHGGPGYGHMWCEIDGEQRCFDAHKLAFLLSKGPVPKGALVLHSCNCKRCVNPAHLRLGTATDNARQALRDGLVGTLRPDDVLAMIRERQAGRLVVEIAGGRGVRAKHFCRIMAGECWGYVTGITPKVTPRGGEQLALPLP